MAGAVWNPFVGETLLIPSGPLGDHLFFILLGPQKLPDHGGAEQFISVSVTTIYPGIPYDKSCVLDSGDHPFIKHPSYVTYRKYRIDPRDHVEQMVSAGLWKPHFPCNPDLIAKIKFMACDSKTMPKDVKAYLGCIPPAR